MVTPTDDPIRNAARATVLHFGVRRAPARGVARRAGVSRMTVYRRYPDGGALVRALMAREFGAVLARAEAEADGANERERLVAAAMRALELLITDPLLLRLLEVDAELLLPYFTGEPGRFQRQAGELLMTRLRAAQAEGSARADDPEQMAAACELAVRGLVLRAGGLDDAQRAGSLRELRRMLDGYLRP